MKMKVKSIAVILMLAAGAGQCVGQESAVTGEVDTKAAAESKVDSPDLAAIREASQSFVVAFNQHDANAVAALWTKDGEYVDGAGRVLVGRDEISKDYQEYFAADPEAKIKIVIDSMRLLSSDTAIEDGRALVDPPPAGAPGVSKYTAVHLKVNGQWLMASVRDSWVETPATRQSTADLGWLIGSWVAEERGVQMNSTCRWVANEHFVQRDFTTKQLDGETSSGVQLIGWNPSIGRVQSWTFSPDGGHAVGTWSLTSTGWMAETAGVTADGTPTTAAIELRRLDDNAYVWQSFDRTIAGASLPDTDEIVIKRIVDKQ